MVISKVSTGKFIVSFGLQSVARGVVTYRTWLHGSSVGVTMRSNGAAPSFQVTWTGWHYGTVNISTKTRRSMAESTYLNEFSRGIDGQFRRSGEGKARKDREGNECGVHFVRMWGGFCGKGRERYSSGQRAAVDNEEGGGERQRNFCRSKQNNEC